MPESQETLTAVEDKPINISSNGISEEPPSLELFKEQEKAKAGKEKRTTAKHLIIVCLSMMFVIYLIDTIANRSSSLAETILGMIQMAVMLILGYLFGKNSD
ncbi:MAG: hypothetical protein FWD82_09870 [Defluviitaleaceae bacterium]|nr:hypothetical protein [Defluviitaleaceae bacterium]